MPRPRGKHSLTKKVRTLSTPYTLHVPIPEEKPEPVEVYYHSFVIDHDLFQVREKIRHDVVNNYMNLYSNGVEMPPITLANIKGVQYLVDGFHRMMAYRKIGVLLPIMAYIIPVKNIKEARWLAYVDNCKHGIPLNKQEKEQGFHSYIAAKKYKFADGVYKSARQMAFELGFWKHPTILKKLKEFYPHVYKNMTRDPDFDPHKAYCGSIPRERSLRRILLERMETIGKQISLLDEDGKMALQRACKTMQEYLQGETKYNPYEEEDDY